MHTFGALRARNELGFAFCAAAVLTGVFCALRLLHLTGRPDLVAYAATIDLAIDDPERFEARLREQA